MRVVAPRSLEQTDMILLHRIRERRVRARTALLNQMRGLLSEYGIVLPAGAATLRKVLPLLLEDAENGLTIAARRYLQDLFDEWRDLDERIHESERSIRTLASESPAACRLMGIRGVGVMIATAALATISSRMADSSVPAWGWFPESTPAGAFRNSGGSANAAMIIYDEC